MSRLSDGAAAVAVLAMICLASSTGCAAKASGGPSQATTSAIASARQFLHDYVTPAGEVIRKDQGGDTVSEGQGYALLLAYAVDNRRLFARIWSWTRSHLLLGDALFAYRWQDGAVASNESAADADTQIAWALDLAGHRWSAPADTDASRQIATAIADHELGYDDHGRPTLAAGPWAIGAGRPTQVEPGYWTFPADAALAVLTRDRRWQGLASADAAHLGAITHAGTTLPSDWAALGSGSAPMPSAAPQTTEPPASGQDGLRALVWASCTPAIHGVAARWWHVLAPTARQGPLTRNLDGTPRDSDTSALSLVATAATAGAAGHRATMRSLLAEADRTARTDPTYYGNAWAALGRVLLTTTLIPGCSP
jgi:endoglucanase